MRSMIERMTLGVTEGRHPGESRDPTLRRIFNWVPAFAGMTVLIGNFLGGEDYCLAVRAGNSKLHNESSA